MEMGERIPGLTDKELENLHANAVRLAQSGTAKQKEQAGALLPLLDAALAERRAAAALTRKPRSPPRAKAKAAAAKTE